MATPMVSWRPVFKLLPASLLQASGYLQARVGLNLLTPHPPGPKLAPDEATVFICGLPTVWISSRTVGYPDLHNYLLGVIYAPVKFTLSLFALVLLLTACQRQEVSRDDEMRKKLQGLWVFDAQFASGHVIHSTTTIAPDGSYLTKMDLDRTNGPRIVSMAGTFRVQDGFLIETPTNYSETNIPVPHTSRARIIRIDDRELQLDYEKISGTVSATNLVVLRRQTK